MPYLIDGHNLISKVASLNLADMDDEMQLIEMLQEFCRLRGKTVEVYFDNAAPGVPKARRFGRVEAHFARPGSTADQAIQQRLLRLDRAARNWIVVSSDQSIQAAARASKASVIPSETFAKMMQDTVDNSRTQLPERLDPSLSTDEIQDWLELFEKDRNSD